MNRNATDERRSDPSPETDAHSSQSTSPEGYCPHCEYAIDPGVCPECGNIVTSAQLDASPRSTRRRRLLRRSVSLVIVLASAIGLYRFYQSDIWLKRLPTSWLMWTEPTFERVNDELIARDLAGALSAQEQRALVLRFFDITSDVRSPRPTGSKYKVNIRIQQRTSTPQLMTSIQDHDCEIWLDGSVANITLVFWHNFSPSYSCEVDTPLQMGTHTVSGKVDLVVNLKGMTTIPYELKFEHPLIVEDLSISSYAKARYGEDVEADCAESWRISVCQSSPSQLDWWFCSMAPKLPIAGTLAIRAHSDHRLLAEDRIEFRAGSNWRAGRHTILQTEIDVANDTLDFVFTPSPQIAFDADFDEYFGGIMEWHGLAIPTEDAPDSQGHCQTCEPPKAHAPDVVRPWDPDE